MGKLHEPDIVDDLMRRLDEISKPPRHIWELARYFYEQRRRLAASYSYVARSPEHVSTVLYEAALESGRIAEAEGRAGMVRELTEAFLDAAERVRREEAWGELYAADAAADESGFAEASAVEAGSRWQSDQ